MNIQLKLFQLYYRTYSAIAPKAAGKSAFRLFQRVRKKNIRTREQPFYNQARHSTLKTSVGEIDYYQLGDTAKKPVLLVHGWDSNAGSMSNIAFALEKQGYHVVAFNLPGHAFSQKNTTNLLECRIAMSSLLEELNIKKPLSVISHSFGSAVAAYTLANMNQPIDKLVFLTNPNKVEAIFKEFKETIHLGAKAYKQMVTITETIIGQPIAKISVAENLKQAKFSQLLLIHDKQDKVLSFQNSVAVKNAVPEAKLVAFEKIGHYRMLWNDEVTAECVQFLTY